MFVYQMAQQQGSLYRTLSVKVYWMSISVVKMIWRKAILLQDDVPQIQLNSATECACAGLL